MGSYTKNIAIIRGLKDGFSADGGPLTGLVKAERYGSVLKIEVTFLNFAPLSEGRYVTALSDGNVVQVVENGYFEGASELNTGSGFAALICYVNDKVSPVASAVSGNFHGAALGIKAEIERLENIRPDGDKTAAADYDKKPPRYEDEAIAEVNYYEFAETDAGGGALRENPQKKEVGRKAGQNETPAGAFQTDGVTPQQGANPLARGNFYERMKGEIEGILSAYPAEEHLESVVSGSKWVKISYGDGKFYVFGVIYGDGKPQYVCYGVPTDKSDVPPESMRGLASFIPLSADERNNGFWVMYQDAQTGASLKIDYK